VKSNDSAESTFLQSVIEAPYDDVPRQVYADWLEERGDSRCEFIRLNCQLFRSTDRLSPENRELQKREWQLAGEIPDRLWLRHVAIPRIDIDPTIVVEDPAERGQYFRLTNPGGALTVDHDGLGRGLRLDGKPIALVWDDREGGDGQRLWHTGETLTGLPDLKQIRAVSDGHFREDRPILDQLRSFIMCFHTGEYGVFPPHVSSFTLIRGEERNTTDFYPTDLAVIPTKPLDSLDEERIRYWRDRLYVQPAVLVLQDPEDSFAFIIDGHHKLMAYEWAIRPARFITIQQARFPDDSATGDFFGTDESARANYNQLRNELGLAQVQANPPRSTGPE